MKDLQKTIYFYDKNAQDYAQKVKDICPKEDLDRFSLFMEKSQKKILDVGCGTGIALDYLAKKGFETTGIDLSEELLKIASKNSPNSFLYQMDMRKLMFDDKNFGGIVAIASILHLEKKDVPDTLNGFYRVMKNDGVLYLSLKKGEGEGMEKDKRYNDEEKYHAYYKEAEVQKLLDNANFKLIYQSVHEYEDKYRSEHPWMNFFAVKS